METNQHIGGTPALHHGSQERLSYALQDASLKLAKWQEAAARVCPAIAGTDVSTPEAFEKAFLDGLSRLIASNDEKDKTIRLLKDENAALRYQVDQLEIEVKRAIAPLRIPIPELQIEALRQEAIHARMRITSARVRGINNIISQHDETLFSALMFALNYFRREVVGYFAWDPVCGDFTMHETAVQAQHAAENALDQERDGACEDPGWNDNTGEICWGVIYGQARVSMLEEKPEHPTEEEEQKFGDKDALMDYTLDPIQADLSDYLPLDQRVYKWLVKAFGKEAAHDKVERNHRFLEEALEVVQACGCTDFEAHQLVEYVFGRPVGEIHQEIGGAMLTLAGLALANGQRVEVCGALELQRAYQKIELIREKQKNKPKHSPLPQ